MPPLPPAHPQPEQTAQEYDDGPILSVLTVAGALITTLAVAAFI